MDYGPLVIQEIEAGERLIREFDRYRPIKAAFWLRAADDNHRYLYLASDRIDDTNFGDAYREVSSLVDRRSYPDLNPFRIKVINGDSPLALDAVDNNTRFPEQMPTRLYGTFFGGMVVDDVYIYAIPSHSPTETVDFRPVDR